mgnify:CR=1 FL=1
MRSFSFGRRPVARQHLFLQRTNARSAPRAPCPSRCRQAPFDSSHDVLGSRHRPCPRPWSRSGPCRCGGAPLRRVPGEPATILTVRVPVSHLRPEFPPRFGGCDRRHFVLIRNAEYPAGPYEIQILVDERVRIAAIGSPSSARALPRRATTLCDHREILTCLIRAVFFAAGHGRRGGAAAWVSLSPDPGARQAGGSAAGEQGAAQAQLARAGLRCPGVDREPVCSRVQPA